jgi:hypothetical protein
MNGKQYQQRRNRWDSVVRQLLASPAPPRSRIKSVRPTFQPLGVVLSADKATRQQLQMGLVKVGFRVVTSSSQNGAEMLQRRGWNLVLIQRDHAGEAHQELVSLATSRNRCLTVLLSERQPELKRVEVENVVEIVQLPPFDSRKISRRVAREFAKWR